MSKNVIFRMIAPYTSEVYYNKINLKEYRKKIFNTLKNCHGYDLGEFFWNEK